MKYIQENDYRLNKMRKRHQEWNEWNRKKEHKDNSYKGKTFRWLKTWNERENNLKVEQSFVKAMTKKNPKNNRMDVNMKKRNKDLKSKLKLRDIRENKRLKRQEKDVDVRKEKGNS